VRRFIEPQARRYNISPSFFALNGIALKSASTRTMFRHDGLGVIDQRFVVVERDPLMLMGTTAIPSKCGLYSACPSVRKTSCSNSFAAQRTVGSMSSLAAAMACNNDSRFTLSCTFIANHGPRSP
jgi:hypothetical protein